MDVLLLWSPRVVGGVIVPQRGELSELDMYLKCSVALQQRSPGKRAEGNDTRKTILQQSTYTRR